jgi:PPP family 3-phenylpropionic acid transporter
MPGKDKDRRERYPWIFVSFYAISYMAYAISNTFFPIYYKQLGYSGSSLGLLLSVGPFVALLSQPFWGIMADRASSKNLILQIICAVSTVSIFLLVADSRFYFLSLSFAMFSFFYYPLFALGDTITLEYLKNTGWHFGPIRLAGTFGFAVMAIIAGKLASRNITNIFFLFSACTAVSFLLARKLPVIRGHQHGRQKISILALLKNREFMFLSVFFLAVMSSMGFYYSFYPVYYEQLGAGRTLVGVSMFVSAVSETPFLLFSSRISRKFHAKYILLGSAAVICLRWLLIYLVPSPYALLPLMLLHGTTFIVMSYAMATYVNNNIPAVLKASGQAVNWIISLGLSRIAGSILGGILVDKYGIRQVFLFNSLFVAVLIAIYGTVLLIQKKRHSLNENNQELPYRV